MRKRTEAEILAPAGTREALTAAVRCGANAVYLGGKLLNARRNAENFDDEALKEAVRYCHERGVKVYFAQHPGTGCGVKRCGAHARPEL